MCLTIPYFEMSFADKGYYIKVNLMFKIIRVFFFAFLLLLGFVLPLSLSRRLGLVVAKYLIRANALPFKIAMTNIDLCFADKDKDWRLNLARSHIIHWCQGLLELGALWFRSNNMNGRWCVSEHGVDELKKTLSPASAQRNRTIKRRKESEPKVIILMPHIGNWEFFCSYLPNNLNIRFTALYKPPSWGGALSNLFIKTLRGLRGTHTHPADITGIRAMVRALKKKGLIMLLPDQEPADESAGIYVPFFKVAKTLTPSLPVRLIRTNNAIVFFAYALRVENGFEVYFERVDGLDAADESHAVEAMNKAIENIIERAPEQYLWSYKRFKYSLRNFYKHYY